MTKETDMRIEQQIAGISYTVDSDMAGNRHTLPCCLSKPRSSLEAGRKQPRVWLEHVCSQIEMLLYSSFGVTIVFLWSPFYGSKEIRYIHGRCTELLWWHESGLTLVSRRCNVDLTMRS